MQYICTAKMATNKHAQIRYKVLDSCFRNTGRDYTVDDLLEACNAAISEFDPSTKGIQRRTLFDDISYMESEAGWSVNLDRLPFGKKIIYRYSDPKFSINNQPLNKTELAQINSALQIISRFNGMPQFSWVNEIVTKINNGFELQDDSSSIISFDSNEYLKGIEFLGDLFNSIHNKKVLSIKYKPFKSDIEIEFILHPYYLKQYNNRWFLFGLSSEYKTISNLALDRIISFEVTKQKYVENKTINFSEYFEDIIGVTMPENGKLMKIELLFSNNEAPYILTKPIHGSQKKIKHDDKGLYLSIDVIPNVELEKLILSFGENVKIIKPVLFKNKIGNRHKKAI